MIHIKETKYTSVRYCTELKQNVVFETRLFPEGRGVECLNRSECGCGAKDCKNRLVMSGDRTAGG